MQMLKRTAFLIRVTWNHSVIGYFAREFGLIFRRGGWTVYAFLGFVVLFTRLPDPMEATYPELTAIAKVVTAAIATGILWVVVDTIRDVKRHGDHLPRIDD